MSPCDSRNCDTLQAVQTTFEKKLQNRNETKSAKEKEKVGFARAPLAGLGGDAGQQLLGGLEVLAQDGRLVVDHRQLQRVAHHVQVLQMECGECKVSKQGVALGCVARVVRGITLSAR